MTTNEKPTLSKVHDYITQRIIEKIESGVDPWNRGFTKTHGPARNAITGKPYRGVNILMTGLVAEDYSQNLWLSFNQARDAGLKVRKGEKSPTFITFFTVIDKRTDTEKELCQDRAWRSSNWEEYKKIMKKTYSFLKYTNVFNIDQIEDPDGKLQKYAVEVKTHGTEPIEDAEALAKEFFTREATTLQTGGNQPSYYPSLDKIRMPDLERYEEAERYYKTLFHEITHATGHETRLNRPGITRNGTDKDLAPGKQSYAFEELIAELGALFISSHLGLDLSKLEDNTASYLEGWIKPLQDNPDWIQKASTQASLAVDFILGNEPGNDN